MITDIEYLKNELRNEVTEKRYIHSLGVMKMCEKLAPKYNVDSERLRLVGLMHDLAKDMEKDKKIKYILDNNIPFSETEKANIEIMHGKIAGHICKVKYKFDEEMCRAISCHTTGKENMTMLEKILFIADKIDETRKYSSAEELRDLAFQNIDKAIIENINHAINKNIDDNKVIIEESIKARNFLLINSKDII